MRAATARWLLDAPAGPGGVPAAARKQRFDCIVVGAGPAGCVAALYMARAGLDVLLLERGPYPGSKTMGGASLYARMMEPLLGEFWREAPLEGAIVNQAYWVLTEEGAVTLGVNNAAFGRQPYNRFSVLKARFSPWLADQARRAGALLLVNHKADRLLVENGRVTGVALHSPYPAEFHAPAVIVAEGSDAILASRAGLIPKIKAENMSLYGKVVIGLPPETIRERFNLAPGQAAVIGFLGYGTRHLVGTGSLYTYRDCIGINAGSILTEQLKAGVNPTVFLQGLLRHPLIQPMVAGGRLLEFTAMMLPEGGYRALPQMVHPGALIVGNAAGLVNGTHGINLAAYSGKFAAEAVIAAHEKGDFSAGGLRLYRELLEDSFVMRDLRANARVPAFYQRHKDIMDVYPKLLNKMAYQAAMVDPIPKREKRRLLWRKLRMIRSPVRLAADMLDAINVMR